MGRYRNVSILAAAIFIQILGLAIQVKRSTENQSSRLIRVWAVDAITPLEKGIVRVQSGVSDLWRNYFYLRGVRQENRALKEQLEQLQLEQVRLQQDANQAHRLQALLGFKEQFIAKTLATQVIGSSGSEQSRTVYIDKGSHDGIEQGMAVISAEGVVGKVITVYKSTAQVLLINDQQSGVGAILEQSRLQGVLEGKASGALVIDKIMADEDVKLGDKVLTSGGDLIFPKGLVIGTVAKVSKGPEFLEVSVKPAAGLNRLEEVLVILKKEEREPNLAGVSQRASEILAQRLPSVPDKPPAAVTHSGSGMHAAVPANSGVAAPAAAGTTQAAAQPKTGTIVPVARPVTTDSQSPNAGTPATTLKPATITAAPQGTKLSPAAPAKPVAETSQPDAASGDSPQ